MRTGRALLLAGAVAVALMALASAAPAQAQSITINVGTGMPYWGPGYGWYYNPYPYYAYPVPYGYYAPYPAHNPRYWWPRRFIAPGPVNGDGEPGKLIWYDQGLFTGMSTPGTNIKLFGIEGVQVPLAP